MVSIVISIILQIQYNYRSLAFCEDYFTLSNLISTQSTGVEDRHARKYLGISCGKSFHNIQRRVRSDCAENLNHTTPPILLIFKQLIRIYGIFHKVLQYRLIAGW